MRPSSDSARVEVLMEGLKNPEREDSVLGFVLAGSIVAAASEEI